MNFIVSSAALYSHLQAISRVINSKNALPILEHIPYCRNTSQALKPAACLKRDSGRRKCPPENAMCSAVPIENRILLSFCATLTILCSTRRANWPSLGKGRRPQEKASAFASIQSAAHRRGTLSMIPAPRAAALAPHEASGTNR